jgi:hypothetical protein
MAAVKMSMWSSLSEASLSLEVAGAVRREAPSGAAVSEQTILDLEREAFLSLCGEEKTKARIQHMLSSGKPLRN